MGGAPSPEGLPASETQGVLDGEVPEKMEASAPVRQRGQGWSERQLLWARFEASYSAKVDGLGG